MHSCPIAALPHLHRAVSAPTDYLLPVVVKAGVTDDVRVPLHVHGVLQLGTAEDAPLVVLGEN